MKKLVSVIVPAYNHELYIQETIYSIINQTYDNIELIVIDDGSKDSTWKKIKSLESISKSRFKRIYFESKINEGICKTYNRLLSKSQGDYIYPIASDDVAKPQAISTLVDFLEKNTSFVLAVGDCEIIDGASNVIGWSRDKESTPLDKSFYKTMGAMFRRCRPDVDFDSEQFGSYESFASGYNYIPNGYLIRKKAIVRIEPFSENAPLEDYYLHLQLSKLGKYKYIDHILFSYRWHGNNTVDKHDYMRIVTIKTRLYEKDLVRKLSEKKWKKIFDRCHKKTIFCFLRFLQLNVIDDLVEKKLVLSIFFVKFTLLRRKSPFFRYFSLDERNYL